MADANFHITGIDTAQIVARPLSVTIPHSGEVVPKETPWLASLPIPLLMFDVDRFVDRLYLNGLKRLQIPTVICPWHRYAVDLNRWAEDVDADSVVGHMNPSGKFPRGLHWSITTMGERLMPGPMSREAHDIIVQKYFEPFHAQVRRNHQILRDRLRQKPLFHLDLHSMPSMGTSEHRDPGQRRADIVISDCEGKACSPEFRERVISAYKSAGFQISVNWPYKGGRITETYGRPASGIEAIQVELNRSLYMDETSKNWIEDRAKATSAQLEMAIENVYSQLPMI